MADNTDVGFFGVEISRVNFRLQDFPLEDIVGRTDVEIVGGGDKFKWMQNDSAKAGTETIKAYKELEDESVAVANEKSFLFGFNQFYARSAYVNLDTANMNALSNCNVVIRVIRVDENPPPPANAPPPKKGQPPPPVQPVDETIFELWVPFAKLLTKKGSLFEFDGYLDDELLASMGVELKSVKSNMLISRSRVAWKLFADNDLAEYVVGSSVVRWERAILKNPPVAWSIHYNDVVDPKAKVKPTPADFRAKYLENIAKLVETQDKVCSYNMTISSRPSEPPAAENEIRDEEPPAPLLPTLSLTNGRVKFDSGAAASVSVDEDIRNIPGLWTIEWKQSPCMFLHRSQVRAFATTILPSSPISKEMLVAISKVVTPEGKALEGSDISIQTMVDVSSCSSPGAELTDITVPYPLTEDEIASGVNGIGDLTVSICLSPAVIPAEPKVSTNNLAANAPKTPADVLSGRHVSGSNQNRDVMKELQTEITDVINQIAQEYVWLFPNPLPKPIPPLQQQQQLQQQAAAALSGKAPSESDNGIGSPTAAGANADTAVPVTQIDRQAEFMHYLSTSGIYHEFKEKLKPRIQRIVRERYGSRGQALGKSGVQLGGDDIAADAQAILGELYIFLVKQCNVVLNSIYSATLVGRDAAELERGPLVDDEIETPGQAFTRLLMQANDAEADNRFAAAEQFHLERLQLLSNEAVLGSEPSSVHDVYARLGEFYLRQSALNATIVCANEEPYQSASRQLFTKGRQALEIAVKAQPTSWKVGLILACALIEADQQEKADELLNSVLSASISSSGRSGNSNRPGTGRRSANRNAADTVATVNLVMPNLDVLDGYESDKLCPADPLIYSVMAASFASQNKLLKTRKCLVLCNRSFIEGGYQPPISTHGAPRRTIVLALSEAAEFLFSFGFARLGNECHKLVLQSEASVTAKAAARNMPPNTVPFIKHAMKRSNVALLLAKPHPLSQQDLAVIRKDRLQNAVEVARDAVNSSPNHVDVANGYLAHAKALTLSRADPAEICDSYLRAIEASNKVNGLAPNGERIIPLQCLVDAAKLMVLLGRYEEALGFMLPACKVHSSSALLLQAGICCLRLERMDDAEDALLESNMLDNRNPNVWGYLALYCLSCSNNRLEEAEKALDQAIRLGLAAPPLLRELATSFMSVDKLLIAEDLIRRTIAIETDTDNANANNNSAARSRKLLADILVGQNQAAKAVQEYKAVLSDPFADNVTKLNAAESCNSLLVSLGRSEEIKAVGRIIETLTNAINRQQA